MSSKAYTNRRIRTKNILVTTYKVFYLIMMEVVVYSGAEAICLSLRIMIITKVKKKHFQVKNS